MTFNIAPGDIPLPSVASSVNTADERARAVLACAERAATAAELRDVLDSLGLRAEEARPS